MELQSRLSIAPSPRPPRPPSPRPPSPRPPRPQNVHTAIWMTLWLKEDIQEQTFQT
ncbi:MAG: hypothetical protein FWE22_04630 [Firmicutes bacterium]|nr:hypothetical protein [Bacillota bacterium]